MDSLVTDPTLAEALVVHPIYALSMLTAFAVILFFPVTKDFDSRHEKTQYYYLQLITLLGAIFGAKFAVLMGDALWPLEPFAAWAALIWSGRSIVGALLFGFLFVEIAKPLMRYRRPPNDRFALLLPFSIAIGRVGCHFTGCCLGLPMESQAAGVSLHPVALYEIAFHVTMGGVLIWLFRNGRCSGQLFAIFMISYGTYRFASEAVRATEKAFVGFSAYQWLALALIVCGIMSYVVRRPGRPANQTSLRTLNG